MGRLADESPCCSTQGKEESGRPSCFTKGTIRYHILEHGQRISRLSRLNAQQNHLKGLLKPSAGLYLKRAIGVCISHKSAGATLLVLPACRGHTLREPKTQTGVESITLYRPRTRLPQLHSGTGCTLSSLLVKDRHGAGAEAVGCLLD